eukprot:TRINITY_DN12319_c0_g1_i2.p1 TRINITY_DN12319_c0_g1~~TRINITY_DN12319_c0_g1_i2.p1  ORF type:complete len:525 (-),score=100.61 TRINITY_DN12319_c0_g1_i2:12-1586(-)
MAVVVVPSLKLADDAAANLDSARFVNFDQAMPCSLVADGGTGALLTPKGQLVAAAAESSCRSSTGMVDMVDCLDYAPEVFMSTIERSNERLRELEEKCDVQGQALSTLQSLLAMRDAEVKKLKSSLVEAREEIASLRRERAQLGNESLDAESRKSLAASIEGEILRRSQSLLSSRPAGLAEPGASAVTSQNVRPAAITRVSARQTSTTAAPSAAINNASASAPSARCHERSPAALGQSGRPSPPAPAPRSIPARVSSPARLASSPPHVASSPPHPREPAAQLPIQSPSVSSRVVSVSRPITFSTSSMQPSSAVPAAVRAPPAAVPSVSGSGRLTSAGSVSIPVPARRMVSVASVSSATPALTTLVRTVSPSPRPRSPSPRPLVTPAAQEKYLVAQPARPVSAFAPTRSSMPLGAAPTRSSSTTLHSVATAAAAAAAAAANAQQQPAGPAAQERARVSSKQKGTMMQANSANSFQPLHQPQLSPGALGVGEFTPGTPPGPEADAVLDCCMTPPRVMPLPSELERR